MMRRCILTLTILAVTTATAAAKWDPKDKQYLEDQFRGVREQVQAIKAQVDALTAQLAELRQNQAAVQTLLIRQQRTLQDMDQMLSSLRVGSDESFTNLRAALTDLRAEHQKAVATLTGRPPDTTGTTTAVTSPTGTSPAARPAGAAVTKGYITVVDTQSGVVTVDLGSGQGIQVGTRLSVFKATDPSTPVGVLEVTQVLDAGNSRARILTMNAGVRPDFSDTVRVE